MSKCSTYVQSVEGHWYINPVIERPEWFICWDDDEPIELVIRDDSRLSVSQVLSDLRKQGWDLIVYTFAGSGQRMFSSEFVQSRWYFLKQRHNGPPDALLIGCKREAREPHREGVYYFNGPNGQ